VQGKRDRDEERDRESDVSCRNVSPERDWLVVVVAWWGCWDELHINSNDRGVKKKTYFASLEDMILDG